MLKDDEIITLSEIRSTGHCVAGIRRWFKAYNIDFRSVVKNGVTVKQIRDCNDQIGRDVLNHIESARSSHGRK